MTTDEINKVLKHAEEGGRLEIRKLGMWEPFAGVGPITILRCIVDGYKLRCKEELMICESTGSIHPRDVTCKTHKCIPYVADTQRQSCEGKFKLPEDFVFRIVGLEEGIRIFHDKRGVCHTLDCASKFKGFVGFGFIDHEAWDVDIFTTPTMYRGNAGYFVKYCNGYKVLDADYVVFKA